MKLAAIARRAVPVVSLFGLGLVGACSSASSDTSSLSDNEALASIPRVATKSACASGVGRFAVKCNAQVRTDMPKSYEPDFTESGHPSAAKSVVYGPKEIKEAYAIPAGGKGVTVALVDAQDDPNAEADLAVFRAKYGLPPCTTANGCFKKVGQDGTSKLPAADYGWAIEISLDLDAVSAACPACNILLVEAEELNAPSSTTVDPLATAVDTAVKMGAKVVSNSYSITEASNENDGILKADALSTASHYIHSGVSIFASSGDSGFATSPNNSGDGKGAGFPADVPQVFAVGGTSLKKSSSTRGWAEGVWGGANAATDGAGNSGCSTFFAKPSYQTDKACGAFRTIADLSAVGDPATGLNIYITYTDPDTSAQDYFPPGWGAVGGTSLSSPLTAAIFAASGKAGVTPADVYAHTKAFYDVTTGNNGTCKNAYLCNGAVGYDAPTGVGTTNGTAFAAVK